MTGFLIEYHRSSGQVHVQAFPSLIAATKERLRLDRLNHDHDLEIAAVASSSEQHLRQSHSRYFERETL